MKKDLKQELGLSESQIKKLLLEKKKYKPQLIEKKMKGNTFKIGVVSDTHLCSNYEALDELHTFYKICSDEGITNMLHAGDILDGMNIYRGQEMEVHALGFDRQIDYVVKSYPKYKEMTTYFINGNHNFWGSSGVDSGKVLSLKRNDLVCIGDLQADFIINNVKIKLFHGAGGSSYALSYKPQKMAEQIQSGQKPAIILFGHWHVVLYFFYRNMHLFNCGAFQKQTPYILRKGINPTIGGWILEIKENEGEIEYLKPTFIPFY